MAVGLCLKILGALIQLSPPSGLAGHWTVQASKLLLENSNGDLN